MNDAAKTTKTVLVARALTTTIAIVMNTTAHEGITTIEATPAVREALDAILEMDAPMSAGLSEADAVAELTRVRSITKATWSAAVAALGSRAPPHAWPVIGPCRPGACRRRGARCGAWLSAVVLARSREH